MLTRRNLSAFALLAVGVLTAAIFAGPVPPDYRLGEAAAEDIVTPVTLRVVDPELSEALKQKNAAGVPLVFRQVVTTTEETERELRVSLETTRTQFLDALQTALQGRMPFARDVGSPAYAAAVREVSRMGADNPPVARFAPLWVRGADPTAIVDTLLQPLREVMAQPIVDDNAGEPLSVDQPIRLVRVRSQVDAPSLAEMEAGGRTTLAAHLSGLESARSVVASYFASDQEDLARFAAGFLRANTFPAPGLTELLRSRRRDEAVGYDTYAAGQVIVKRGQPVDRKALAALAALREQHQIDALLTRVEAKSPAVSPAIVETRRFVAWVGAAGLLVLLLLWRWGGGGRTADTEVSVAELPIVLLPAMRPNAEAEQWRTRALLAEQRAERAQEAIRQGALGWMKEKLFRSVFHQRADLLATQQKAEAEIVALEQRMGQLLVPLQERIRTYENRIQELEVTLAGQNGDERRLIDARLSRARQQLELERARVG